MFFPVIFLSINLILDIFLIINLHLKSYFLMILIRLYSLILLLKIFFNLFFSFYLLAKL